jgi:hypothetical protein
LWAIVVAMGGGDHLSEFQALVLGPSHPEDCACDLCFSPLKAGAFYLQYRVGGNVNEKLLVQLFLEAVERRLRRVLPRPPDVGVYGSCDRGHVGMSDTIVRLIVSFDYPVFWSSVREAFVLEYPSSLFDNVSYPLVPLKVDAGVAVDLCAWQWYLLSITDPQMLGSDGPVFGCAETVIAMLERLYSCTCGACLVSTMEAFLSRSVWQSS